jgi:hypothetical protein
MKGNKWLTWALVIILGIVFIGGQYSQAFARQPKILVFDSMSGLPSAFTGSQNPIRGINGGGLTWRLTSASGGLNANGGLQIAVRGLVFAEGVNEGQNTVPNFKAIVSCLTSDAQVVNVSTALFPATLGFAEDGGGNADIKEKLTLPQPCIAPLIFVTSPTGAWFAVTGN